MKCRLLRLIAVVSTGLMLGLGMWLSTRPVLAANGIPTAPTAQTTQSAPPEATPATTPGEAPFRLHVESNLVVVRVVVRDSQGRPVENLHKEDFRLLDDGREQKISQFSVEAPSGGTAVAQQTGTSEEVKRSSATEAPAPPRALAFYFDDLNMALDEINSARDAADSYLAKSLRPPDRAAIFTSSGAVHTDFTSDLNTLHEALTRVIPIPNLTECPQISDYQAERIIEYEDRDALRVAISDAKMRCHMSSDQGGSSEPVGSSPGMNKGTGGPSSGKKGGSMAGGSSAVSQSAGMPVELTVDDPSPIVAFVKQEAEIVLNQSWQRSQRSLAMLNAIVLGMAHMRGQKEIILTSPGFIPRNLGEEVDHVIDKAVAAQIVISSLDPKGVALLAPALDVSSNFDPKLISLLDSFASSRELYASAVLAQIATETGGDFFHHNNDLKAGFNRLGEEPFSYILGFAPSDLDGKFHKLQVKLTESRGAVQARRGYFAVKKERNEQEELAEQAAQKTEELRQLVASKEEIRELSIDVSTQVAPASGESKELAVLVRLDLGSVLFRKEGDRNVNTLTFVAGIYDSAGKWITGQQKQFDLKLPDAQLQDMRAKGVGVQNKFQLKPGKYLLREVVQDSEEHHFAAVNREVQVQ